MDSLSNAQRTAKSVDGLVVEKYLWGGVNQQLLAVLDGSDAVVARFEYAGGQMPVAMVLGGTEKCLAQSARRTRRHASSRQRASFASFG